ncbi:unnamed protein product [Spirodela intermedia]|uniref:Uncharacterized protein n=1 Tax=Spirodela intermedia TaxID=51605 RepID=A0A7I8JTT5_SPIIN|nr:unnamed protein product [Spirodela intermedia]CAA6672862.1 unnamed protein product [Spirodela intermedia]
MAARIQPERRLEEVLPGGQRAKDGQKIFSALLHISHELFLSLSR